ncbi:hypothetical protein HOC35_07190 [Candidatus Woesearchaeota archaeon]|jgi:seryl-tRNA synthetase|nr:hypothetical protein [Candidatus Woesearchaeota archaeon]
MNSDEDLFNKEILMHYFQNSGQYIIKPKGVKLLNTILKLLSERIETPLGFEEVYLPKIIPFKTAETAGIIDKWDNYLISVMPYGETKGVEEHYLMDPLQCLAFYQAFKNQVVDVSNGAIKWYDHSGPTYRNEDLDKIRSSIKQREFHRAEFVYLGTEEQVRETRDQGLENLEQLCQDLGLKTRIVEGDSCYQEGGDIVDLEIYLPQEDEWLELAGGAILFDITTKKFNISSTTNENLWSGCLGIGLNRFMYAMVAYHSTNIEKDYGVVN